MEELLFKGSGKQFNQLKNDSKLYSETQSRKPVKNKKLMAILILTNSIVFTQNIRMSRPEDDGYQDWFLNNDNTSEEPIRDYSLTKETSTTALNQVCQFQNRN